MNGRQYSKSRSDGAKFLRHLSRRTGQCELTTSPRLQRTTAAHQIRPGGAGHERSSRRATEFLSRFYVARRSSAQPRRAGGGSGTRARAETRRREGLTYQFETSVIAHHRGSAAGSEPAAWSIVIRLFKARMEVRPAPCLHGQPCRGDSGAAAEPAQYYDGRRAKGRPPPRPSWLCGRHRQRSAWRSLVPTSAIRRKRPVEPQDDPHFVTHLVAFRPRTPA